MLEAQIAAFVAAVDAAYPAGTAARSPAEQRRIYDRFAAAVGRPPNCRRASCGTTPLWRAPHGPRSRCGATRRRTAHRAAPCCFSMAGGFGRRLARQPCADHRAARGRHRARGDRRRLPARARASRAGRARGLPGRHARRARCGALAVRPVRAAADARGRQRARPNRMPDARSAGRRAAPPSAAKPTSTYGADASPLRRLRVTVPTPHPDNRPPAAIAVKPPPHKPLRARSGFHS